jgi:hypothetical protein
MFSLFCSSCSCYCKNWYCYGCCYCFWIFFNI